MVARAIARSSADDLIARFGLATVGGFLFATGFRIFPATSISSIAVIVTLLLYIGGFASWALALSLRDPFANWTQAILAAASTLGLVASVAYGILYEIPSYGTDVIALAHAGGEVLLDGVNPYSVTREEVLPILERMSLQEGLITQTLSGSPIEGVTYYPGLHVLAYATFVAMGFDDLRWATLVFELLAIGIIWAVISPRLRFLIPAVLLIEPYLTVTFTSGGVTDWLWVLPLAISAYLLHRGSYPWCGLWLGFACAVKQQPWFAIPFVAIYLFHQVSGTARYNSSNHPLTTVASFFAMLGLGFLLPNLPFILWSPGDWWQGILAPAFLDLIPDGQGLVLLQNQGLLALTRLQFSLLMVVVIALLCLTYFAFFDRYKNVIWLLPPFVLFFAYRSLHSYFVFWLPVAAMWLGLEVAPSDDTPSSKDPKG